MTFPRTFCLLFASVLTLTLSAAPAQEGTAAAERPAVDANHQAEPLPAPCVQEEAGTWPVKTLTLLLQLTDEEQLFT